MIVIDKYSRKPIYEQIIDGIEKQIMSGVMGELDKLPSIRELSVALSINPNTIQKAFLELDRAGIIFSNQGRGCFVAADAKEKIRKRKNERIDEFCALARELSLCGIDRETLISKLDEIYDCADKEGEEK